LKPLVIEVPSPLGLRPSGLERAPEALRRAGLHERLGSTDAVRIDIPPFSAERDPLTEVRNADGIAEVARELADAVDDGLDAGRFPVVLGGDCSILLGPMMALRRRGRHGLAFLDGHADFSHPSDEPNGEVAALELALATGRGPGVLTDLDGLGPLVQDEDVALVGYRVHGGTDHFHGEHVRSTAMTVVDLPAVRAQGAARALDHALATVARPELDGFWVHMDVDVLDDALMPAVDYRHPGGLCWNEAAEILGGLVADEGARGVEVTIFNPRLDPSAAIAPRLADLIAFAVLSREDTEPGT
jgi:arginase